MNDPLAELVFAVAEGDAVEPSAELRDRVVDVALSARPAGHAADPPAWISGAEVLRRAIVELDVLLGELDPSEWSLPALRDLDVQGLVGHLIGVENAFLAALAGDEDAGRRDHVAGTQGDAKTQVGVAPDATRRSWFERSTTTVATVTSLDGSQPLSFYGVTMPLDDVLVIRAFEMWIHHEDIRRATGRPLAAIDPERLARMTTLAVALLPAGIALAGPPADPGRAVRLVLTGAGGGTHDFVLSGAASAVGRERATRVVVDATEFCRVVGNRQSEAGSRALVTGDADVASTVFVGAAALALD